MAHVYFGEFLYTTTLSKRIIDERTTSRRGKQTKEKQ
jgi:hypothetical protein